MWLFPHYIFLVLRLPMESNIIVMDPCVRRTYEDLIVHKTAQVNIDN